ncbi:MAG: hypothetical protein KF830_15850 [Planctomycetes bacterium]|nr:hypothetical protein [Planctomycetota bacterium]
MISITKLSFPCFLALAAALPAQEHDLRVAAKKGATVWIAQESKVEQTIDMGGQEMETGRHSTTILQLTVKDVDDKGLLVVETKVARIHGSMTMPMLGDIEFDSAKADPGDDDGGRGGMGMPSPGAMAKAQTALAGKTFVAKVGPDGKVAAIEGADDLLKPGRRGNRMTPSPTESDLKTLVESAFGMVPAQPTAIGGSWDHKLAEGAGMPAVSMKLTLAKVDADSFEVTAAGTIEPPKPGEQGDDMQRKMMESLKISNSKANGVQRVSRQDGFVLDAAHTVTMEATMDGPMGGEMSMQVKASTTVKRTTAAAAMPPKAEAAK